ncbi:baseplate J/gp47 family protein [Corallococcus exiguus]|uniref:baseplate J/gp47 family protein n=1 Tax=Corallococcus exiguus TaxID=83462 RepID=UPI0014722436|nr:baseplate J/gp47 family protein [Corallococcus exiguus]NNB89936.1 hypothetical protein [Corallococcus exiguus]
MPTEYGVTSKGFVPRTLDEAHQAVVASLRTQFGPALALTARTPDGVLAGLVGDMLGEVWAAGGGLWGAFDGDAAEGEALDGLCALTGTRRLQATASTVALSLSGDAGTVVPAGSVASVAGVGTRFATAASATLVAVSAWAPDTVYAEGAVVVGDGRVWRCRVAGSSGSAGGPSGSGLEVVDGGVTWRLLGAGVALASVAASAEEVGPLPAPAYSLTSIETPVAGWRGVANPLDAEEGRETEDDDSLRARRVLDLRAQGNASVEAIRARMLDASTGAGATSCIVFENVSAEVDADGVPPHAVEVLVEGGEAQRILETLWQAKAGGIETHGTESGTVLDSQGKPHVLRFSRPELLDVYVEATAYLTPDAPADDEVAKATLRAAVVALGDSLQVGRNVVRTKVEGALVKVSWVEDVSGLVIGTSPGSLGTVNIDVTTRQRARLDSSRVALTLVRLGVEDL